MDEPHVARTTVSGGANQEIVSHADAIKLFARVLESYHQKLTSYWWRLSGNDANSLCRLLGVDADAVVNIYRKCNVLVGPQDKFRLKNFEMLIEFCGLDWSKFRPVRGELERFIKIGIAEGTLAVGRPKEMYSEGMLSVVPEPGVHMLTVMTKQMHSQQDLLVASATTNEGQTSTNVDAGHSDDQRPSNPIKHTLADYIIDILGTIEEELATAGCAYSQRLDRKLTRLLKKAVKQAGFELFCNALICL